ncbi:MAG: TolC family outer membrane protein [Trichlorobacter sp.]|uniref:TolC family outer membrane protein n=1 Tax=Trichlorobacter sp. TaxID=2911007 RepID=UPI00256C035F|nr:TolC family outer membrane protein [Trichlorobacter sp.]MDK9716591.1 TolC family outer membrane protein [Trichlorobacter sp.]
MKLISCLMLGLLISSTAYCADLAQLYQTAKVNDPTFSAARATRDAAEEKYYQGRSGLLPSVTLSGNVNWHDQDVRDRTANTTAHNSYDSYGYNLNLTQPLFRWQNWVGFNQSKLLVSQADLVYRQAEQELILRLAQAYFDVLYASENLQAVHALQKAIDSQLQRSRNAFEVGVGIQTDVFEAESRYDLALAQVASAETDLAIRRQALQLITGQPVDKLAPQRRGVALPSPQPLDSKQWLENARTNNLAVQQQQLNVKVSSSEVDKQRAGHYPTVDFVASKGYNDTLSSGHRQGTDELTAGIQISIPLYQGGVVTSRQREAVANRRAAESNLTAAQRAAELSARQAYLSTVNGLAQVKALRAAVESSIKSMDSNRAAFDVGIRVNIDVLNAENQVYSARRDLARAYFDTVMSQLKLKAAVGTLGEDDLMAVNGLLDPSQGI